MTHSLAPEILAYYARGEEAGRLLRAHNRLELWRTQDVLRRLLADLGTGPLRILDVGGGAGVHAEWLAADGHLVTLVDPVPLHVEQAGRLPGVTALHGDARALEAADDSVDLALLLGPLYHLPERADRLRALAEARRVVRPGGLVVAATINRFAGLHDTMRTGAYFEPTNQAATDACVATGTLRPASEHNLFTTAYFHLAAEVPAEFAEAGLTPTGQYGLEGAAWLMGIDQRLDDPAERAVVLDALRAGESEPSLLGVSGHLLTAGIC
ncbi:class I SAM-dependent methyltransferase [Kitasatospora azatica]|uniref:class I SAM-dependent methyltransferase n=1 Tax=Kitasatospora azatica TaxID=58347 RepID=UPI00056440C9|nr:class I SAM-dependent methyltransferase [Kitasatospora azatica]